MPSWPPETQARVTAELRAGGCVFAEEEAQLVLEQAGTATELERMVARRVAGERLEHILGWAAFAGRRVMVAPGVFVPRHSTELLVEEAVALGRRVTGRPAGGRPAPERPVVLVICCGSGAIGVAVAAELGAVELHATDIDAAAVRCARENLAGVGAVYEGDLFAALPAELRGRVDILAANVPYVPTRAIELMPRDAWMNEPRVALDGGEDGLAVLRRVAAEARDWLAPGGCLLVETSERQVEMAAGILTGAGLAVRVVWSEEDWGAAVVVGAAA